MKLFSRTLFDYATQLKWGFLALFVMGAIRFLMGPVGVPIAAGGMATSITIVLLVGVIAYGVYFGRTHVWSFL